MKSYLNLLGNVILQTDHTKILWKASSWTDDFYFVKDSEKINELDNKIKNKESKISALENEKTKIEKELQIQSHKLEEEKINKV